MALWDADTQPECLQGKHTAATARTCGPLEPDLHAGQLRYPRHVLTWVGLDDVELAVLRQRQRQQGRRLGVRERHALHGQCNADHHSWPSNAPTTFNFQPHLEQLQRVLSHTPLAGQCQPQRVALYKLGRLHNCAHRRQEEAQAEGGREGGREAERRPAVWVGGGGGA